MKLLVFYHYRTDTPDSEETIIVNRVIRDDPSKGDMHNRQPITPKLLLQSMGDYDLWPLYVLGLTFQMGIVPVNQYMTLTLRELGFSVVVTNLLTVPTTFLTMCTMLAITYLSEIWKEIAFTAMIPQFWVLPFLVYLYVVDITATSRWAAWAVLTLLLAFPSGKPFIFLFFFFEELYAAIANVRQSMRCK